MIGPKKTDKRIMTEVFVKRSQQSTCQVEQDLTDANHSYKQPFFPLKSQAKQLLFFILGIATCFALQYALPLLLNPYRIHLVLQNLGSWAAIFFVGLHLISTVLGIPGIFLTLAGGIFFGVFWGSLWSLIGATLGAIAAFGCARYWMHDWFTQRFYHNKILKSLNSIVTKQPIWVVLSLRFSPISPFNVLNFVLGLTKLPFIPYAIGTFIGIIPGVIVYTWIGQAGFIVTQGAQVTSLVLAGCTLAGLSALPVIFSSPIQTSSQN